MIRLMWMLVVLGVGLWIGSSLERGKAIDRCIDHGGTWIQMLGICQ